VVTAMDAGNTTAARWNGDHWRFLAITLLPALLIAIGRLHALPSSAFLASHLSLATAPRSLHHTVTDVLFVPIGALVVVFFRLTLGIRVLGPFRSILLAFAFLVTGVWLGLIFLTATVAILVATRPLIRTLRLPYFGRVSLMLSAVAMLMVVGTLSGAWLQSPALRNVAHFPIVVLVLVGEKVAVTMSREGTASGIWRAAMTALIGVVVTAVASIPGIDALLLAHPELMLVEMALIAVVSTRCNWRLLERLNPTPRERSSRAQGAPALSPTLPSA
jgi:uncharacterized protein with transglutaminase domain